MSKGDRMKLERTLAGSLEDVWHLWTTRGGLESWWGPDGFRVEVRRLDLRPGGILEYAMIATGKPQIDFMKKAGMPLTTEARITYKEVTPLKRLAYDHLVDFVPRQEPYSVSTLIELRASAQGVRMVLTSEGMHDEEWTRRAAMGWESELDRLQGVLTARGGGVLAP